MSSCALLFSGGTDSLCAAALAAEKYSHIHLLTYYERGTDSSPLPNENVDKLRGHFSEVKFLHLFFSTDTIVRKLSYESYMRNFFSSGFYNLATPGLSSLSWHVRTIRYCLEHNIKVVYDGMTAELLHLPGHMPEVRHLFKDLYRAYGIEFSSPVIEWEVPEDQRFTDKLIVDRHGFMEVKSEKRRTTGLWLFEKGILPHPNVKGSEFDRLMQHDCYPFVVYNMLVFWFFEPLIGYEKFKGGLLRFMSRKIAVARMWLDANIQNSGNCSFLQSNNENT